MCIDRISVRRAAKKILTLGVALSMLTSAPIVQVAAAETDAIAQPATGAQTGPLPAAGAGGIHAAQGVDLDDETLVILVGGAVLIGLAAFLLSQGTSQSTVSTTNH